MRILIATSEAYPLIKTGGLADVSSSLSVALCQQGTDVRLLIAGYPAVLSNVKNLTHLTVLNQVPKIGSVTLMQGEMPDSGIPIYVVVNARLYQRDGGPYQDHQGNDWIDNPIRFGVMSHVAAVLSSGFSPISWKPDIVHCNDWQTGLTPAILHYLDTTRAKTVLGIHNLAYQGIFGYEWVHELGLPESSFNVEGLEYYGQMSFLKAGAYYSDSIITVSPTYAQEIQTAEYGYGMQGLLAARHTSLHGILNGIDSREWNPAVDPYLDKHYDSKHMAGKVALKKSLQARLDLDIDANAPLLAIVSRFASQKGLDLVLECASDLVHEGVQFAILGSGDALIEHSFTQLGQTFPGKVKITIGYNEPLSHHIMAGSDIFLMPSRFEPCGLNQLYGLAYGTPPVVRRTGGLADSVHDSDLTSLKSGAATGFVFDHASVKDFAACVRRAIDLYSNKRSWKKLQHNGMTKDLSWTNSAKEYLKVYQSLLLK